MKLESFLELQFFSYNSMVTLLREYPRYILMKNDILVGKMTGKEAVVGMSVGREAERRVERKKKGLVERGDDR